MVKIASVVLRECRVVIEAEPSDQCGQNPELLWIGNNSTIEHVSTLIYLKLTQGEWFSKDMVFMTANTMLSICNSVCNVPLVDGLSIWSDNKYYDIIHHMIV